MLANIMSSPTGTSSHSQNEYSDRRAHERVPARFEVRFQKTEQAARAFRAWSVNLSAGGLALKVAQDYAIGERLELGLEVEDESYAVEGIVAWRRGDVIGVRFELSDDDLRERLRSLAHRFKQNPA